VLLHAGAAASTAAKTTIDRNDVVVMLTYDDIPVRPAESANYQNSGVRNFLIIPDHPLGVQAKCARDRTAVPCPGSCTGM
jgi:hypothetical protein